MQGKIEAQTTIVNFNLTFGKLLLSFRSRRSNSDMAQKRPISFRVHPTLADRFQENVGPYYGKLGACFSAALLMFLEADPKTQGAYLKRIQESELDDEVEEMINIAKAEQLKRIQAREATPKGKRGG